MINEYEWIDNSDECHCDFGAKDFALGWVIFSIAVSCLII